MFERYKNVFNEAGDKNQKVEQNKKNVNLNKKRKSSLSSINFYHGIIPHQKNINCINIYNPKNFPQKSYYNGIDDALSVDTYEL